jgi:hypothetical protein
MPLRSVLLGYPASPLIFVRNLVRRLLIPALWIIGHTGMTV